MERVKKTMTKSKRPTPWLRRQILATLAAAGLLFGAAGCQSPEATILGESGFQLGKLKVMTAADENAERTDLSVMSIRITVTGIDARTTDGVFYRFQVEGFDVDLVQLEDGLSLALSRVKIPAGSYDLIRLHTTAAGEVRYQDGTSETLVVPSGTTTGLKIHFEPAIAIQGEQLTVTLLEFDVLKSLVRTSKAVLFKPVVRTQVVGPVTPPAPVDDGSTDGGTTDGGSTDGGLIDESDSEDDLFVPVLGV